MIRFTAVFVALVVAVAACADGLLGPERDLREPIQTDRTLYVPEVTREKPLTEVEFEIVAHFTNQTSDTLWLSRCFPDTPYPTYGIELLGEGESAYDPAWACVGHDRNFVVEPGASRVDTLPVSGPVARDGETHEALGRLEGRMRTHYDARLCENAGRCRQSLPPDRARSNAFEVRLPDGVEPR